MIPKCDPFSEMEGFVLFRPKETVKVRQAVLMTMNFSRVWFSAYATKYLGKPECVLTFFNENKQQLMITPGENSMKNTIPLVENGAPNKRCITKINFIKKVVATADIEYEKDLYYKIVGHTVKVASQPTLIFNLASLQPYTPRKRSTNEVQNPC